MPRALGVPDALRELGLADVGRDLHAAGLQITLDLDAEGQMTHHTLRTLLRATTEGAQRWFHLVFAEVPLPQEIVLEVVHGASVGATYTREEVGLYLWELCLPRPLSVGETAIIETRTRLSPLAERDTSYFHHLDRRTPDTVIWVRFHPDAPPARCFQTLQELDAAAAGDAARPRGPALGAPGGAVVRPRPGRAHLGVVSRA